MNKQRVLFYSNHYRRSPFFEQTMKMIWEAGYENIFIQNTGSGPYSQYAGPAASVTNLKNAAYDTGMISFRRNLNVKEFDAMVLIDNDCFLSGMTHLEGYIEEFIEGKYDFVSHHISESCYTPEQKRIYKSGIKIIPMLKQDFLPEDSPTGFTPSPHWENAYLIVRPQMWLKLSLDDVSHGRKYIRALARESARMGSHDTNYRGSHSHSGDDLHSQYGDEWFHVGALMPHYNHLEALRMTEFREDSGFDMARLGYFIEIEKMSEPNDFPIQYSENIKKIMETLVDKNRPTKEWSELIRGTCMENWGQIKKGDGTQ